MELDPTDAQACFDYAFQLVLTCWMTGLGFGLAAAILKRAFRND